MNPIQKKKKLRSRVLGVLARSSLGASTWQIAAKLGVKQHKVQSVINTLPIPIVDGGKCRMRRHPGGRKRPQGGTAFYHLRSSSISDKALQSLKRK